MTNDQSTPPNPSTAVTPEHAPAMPNALNSDPFPRPPEPEHSIPEAEVKPSAGNQEPCQTPFIGEEKAMTDKRMAEDHYPPPDQPDLRQPLSLEPAALPDWARLSQPGRANVPDGRTSSWTTLVNAYFAARHSITPEDTDPIQTELGVIFTYDFINTKRFVDVANAAQREMSRGLQSEFRIGGARAIAAQAYDDAIRDRVEQIRLQARPEVNPFAPAGAPSVSTEPPNNGEPQ